MSCPAFQYSDLAIEEKNNMKKEQSHLPVMLEEVIQGMKIKPDGRYLDATFGRGGHSKAILNSLDKKGALYVLDQDPEAIKVARELAATDSRVQVLAARFTDLGDFSAHSIERLDSALIDFGVSSPQLDDPSRGFSFRYDGPLDMRMNPEQGQSAKEWLSRASTEEIAYALKTYADEKYSQQIAEKIVETRKDRVLETTKDLVNCVLAAVPSIKSSHHPATKVFQAVRMQVNDEMRELTTGLALIVEKLKPGGRLVTLTYHSLEHKSVSNVLKNRGSLPELSFDLTSNLPQIRRVGSAQSASHQEVRENARARSALLRIWEKKT